MREVGFEPTKAKPTDLKSVPFDRSGIHAYRFIYILNVQINFIYINTFNINK